MKTECLSASLTDSMHRGLRRIEKEYIGCVAKTGDCRNKQKEKTIDFLREEGNRGKFAASKEKINFQGQRTKYKGQRRTEISLYNPLNP